MGDQLEERAEAASADTSAMEGDVEVDIDDLIEDVSIDGMCGVY